MRPGPNPVTKDEAVRRLRAAGFTQEADDLETWRDANGNNWGWDGWPFHREKARPGARCFFVEGSRAVAEVVVL